MRFIIGIRGIQSQLRKIKRMHIKRLKAELRKLEKVEQYTARILATGYQSQRAPLCILADEIHLQKETVARILKDVNGTDYFAILKEHRGEIKCN